VRERPFERDPFQSPTMAWLDEPRPSTKRPPESCCNVAADIASTAGVRL
jgi:hypothetical protein